MTAIHHFWLGASPYSAVVVSGLFPAYAQDACTSALVPTGGTLVEMPRPVEEVTATLALSSGTMMTMLAGAQDNGAVRPSLILASGALVSGLQLASQVTEAVAPALAISNGSLVLGLISTQYASEAVGPTLSVTSGTLT